LKFLELSDRPLGIFASLGQFRQIDVIAVLGDDFGGGHCGMMLEQIL